MLTSRIDVLENPGNGMRNRHRPGGNLYYKCDTILPINSNLAERKNKMITGYIAFSLINANLGWRVLAVADSEAACREQAEKEIGSPINQFGLGDMVSQTLLKNLHVVPANQAGRFGWDCTRMVQRADFEGKIGWTEL